MRLVLPILIASIIVLGYLYLSGEITSINNGCTTTTVTLTKTVTVTVYTTPSQRGYMGDFVEIVESGGECGVQEMPTLSLVRKREVGEGNEYVVWVAYREQARDPCNIHAVKGDVIILPIDPPIIRITLELQRTSEVCVQCVGVVETVIRIGSPDYPIPAGTKIEINGLSLVI